jgi:hypothetical protein
MTTTAKPFVLHVDDVPDDLRTWEREVNATGRVVLGVHHPNDVTSDHLQRATVVLVDFKMDKWPERDAAVPIGLRPVNGLALLTVLQEAAYDLDKTTPRAFALFTAEMRAVARGLVPQPHIIARANNLEWVFDKKSANLMRATCVAELATAVLALPKPWPGDSSDTAGSALAGWLALPCNATWRTAAWEQILRCRPPIHEVAEHTHGIGVLRWALHRILPYPTFLIDDAHLASRLRVDLGSLREEISASPELAELIAPARYEGGLGNFAGRRWWRAAIESMIFDLASSDPASMQKLHAELQQRARSLKVIDAEAVFPVINEDYDVKDQLANASDVVEVVPDDWPPFADSAWALRSDIEAEPALEAIAASPDQR